MSKNKFPTKWQDLDIIAKDRPIVHSYEKNAHFLKVRREDLPRLIAILQILDQEGEGPITSEGRPLFEISVDFMD
jgi:hypothetical protein